MKNKINWHQRGALLLITMMWLSITHSLYFSAEATQPVHDTLPKPQYVYHGLVTEVYDGDTFTIMVDLGFNVHITERFRLLGLDTPEVRGPEKVEGLKVRDHVRDLILMKPVMIKSKKKGKFGRWLVEVLYIDGNGNRRDLTTHLLETGRAEPYE